MDKSTRSLRLRARRPDNTDKRLSPVSIRWQPWLVIDDPSGDFLGRYFTDRDLDASAKDGTWPAGIVFYDHEDRTTKRYDGKRLVVLCRQCGFGIPGNILNCPNCNTQRIDRASRLYVSRAGQH